MKKQFFFAFYLFVFVFSIKALSNDIAITKEKAFQIAQKEFDGVEPDFFVSTDTTNSDTWTFFVDTDPFKGWKHDCYIIEISKTDNKIIRKELLQEPILEGDFIPLQINNRTYSASSKKPIIRKKLLTSEEEEQSKHIYAIILSGGISKYFNHERYWNDCSFIYQTLTKRYGVPKANIYPIMADGNNPEDDVRTLNGFKSQDLDLDGYGLDEIELAATKENIQNTIDILHSRMSEDDHLFIFVIDHGEIALDPKDNTRHCNIRLWGDHIDPSLDPPFTGIDLETVRLKDYELANWLSIIEEKSININVILGQCNSGGFIDYLNYVGCVAASAAKRDEASYAFREIEYDVFVYYWTCAINGANHLGVSNNNIADVNNDGKITMDEAFAYAKQQDSIYLHENNYELEHPQYISTPKSIGEDLSFDHLPKPIDLYIKDNHEDTGKEPIVSKSAFWLSPSIWIRNEDDGYNVHEEPESSEPIINVAIHNRGKRAYKKGKWLHIYWAKASSSINNDVLKGLEFDEYGSTGGIISTIHIPPIGSCDSCIIKTKCNLPQILLSEDGDYRNHFFYIARITDSETEDDNDIYFSNIPLYNNYAQKNYSSLYRDELTKGVDIYVRNPRNESKNYSLEIVPHSDSDIELFSRAIISLEMNPTKYKAWNQSDYKTESILFNSGQIVNGIYDGVSPILKKDITLEPKETAKTILKVKFISVNSSLKVPAYTIDLIQRDESGEIVGGGTFTIEPIFNEYPINIQITEMAESFKLSADMNHFKSLSWYDNNFNLLGKGEEVSVNPTIGYQDFSAIAVNDEGKQSAETVHFNINTGIKKFQLNDKKISIEFFQQPENLSFINVISLLDNQTVAVFKLDKNIKQAFDISHLPAGIYTVALYKEDKLIDNYKVVLQ